MFLNPVRIGIHIHLLKSIVFRPPIGTHSLAQEIVMEQSNFFKRKYLLWPRAYFFHHHKIVVSWLIPKPKHCFVGQSIKKFGSEVGAREHLWYASKWMKLIDYFSLLISWYLLRLGDPNTSDLYIDTTAS